MDSVFGDLSHVSARTCNVRCYICDLDRLLHRGSNVSFAKRQPVDWASKSILDLCFFQSGWPFVCVHQSTGNERPQPRRDRQILEILMYNPDVFRSFRLVVVANESWVRWHSRRGAKTASGSSCPNQLREIGFYRAQGWSDSGEWPGSRKKLPRLQ